MKTKTDPRLSAALSAEAKRQGLSVRELATKAGLTSTRVHECLTGATDPRWSAVVGILAGLGKSLAWLDREVKKCA
jgi:DNA-binding phage protein